MSAPTMKGTRTPQMLEYERQAEERAREMAQVAEDRQRMADEMDRMTREQERIAQEEYEMRQYYEAEALRHAEEMRLHKEGPSFPLPRSLRCSRGEAGEGGIPNDANLQQRSGGTKSGYGTTSGAFGITKPVRRPLPRSSSCRRVEVEPSRSCNRGMATRMGT